jgi:hypothetical protein
LSLTGGFYLKNEEGYRDGEDGVTERHQSVGAAVH